MTNREIHDRQKVWVQQSLIADDCKANHHTSYPLMRAQGALLNMVVAADQYRAAQGRVA